MEVYEAIKRRRSVRSYRSDPVPDDVIMRLLEAARLAPSAMNCQPWRFIVVKANEARKQIARGGHFAHFLDQTPVVIVGCGDTRSAWYIHDTCIALQNLVVAATAEGLGTCWIGSFNADELRELLKIPGNYQVVALIAVGYPKESLDLTRLEKHLVRRKKQEEIAFLEDCDTPFFPPKVTSP